MTEIRLIRPDDLPPVLRMIHALAAYHGDRSTLTSQALARDALGQHPWITLLVAEGAGGVLGYAALCPLAQLQFGVRGMDMHHLFVTQSAREKGIGCALITESLATARAKGAAYVTVGTHPDNTAAQAIYLKAGFEARPESGPRFRMLL